MFSLPPINVNESVPQHAIAQKEFRCPLLKLPSWDQPAVIKWEPLEPPSPYAPSLQRHRYPSVMGGFPRVARNDVNKEKRVSTTDNNISKVNTHCEMTLEQEEALLLALNEEEYGERHCIIFFEQRELTHLWVKFLHHLSLFLDGDIEQIEEEARAACEREESRRRMCHKIEMESSALLIQRRLRDFLCKSMSGLMPLYVEGRNSIMDEEAKELKPILDWFKNKRPFGTRLPSFFVNNNNNNDNNNNCMIPKKPIAKRKLFQGAHRGGRSNISKTTKQITSPVLEDSWPDTFPEKAYQEEGRIAWKHYKTSRYTEKKVILFSQSGIEEACEKAYNEIVSEEAAEWLSLTALSVESYHDAKRRAQEREEEELKAELECLEELKKREEIFTKLESREFSIWDEVVAVGNLQQREKYLQKMEQVALVNDELQKIEYLRRREINFQQLENNACIKRELDALEELRRREAKFVCCEEACELDTPMSQKDEAISLVCNEESVATDAGVSEQLNAHACQKSGREEGSSSCGSDRQTAPLHPKLGVVLSVALKRDPLVALHNPTLSALGDAERGLAACEGRSSSRTANVLAFATRMAFCPAYLVHVLWSPRRTLTEPCFNISAGVDGEFSEEIQRFLELEIEERDKIMMDQIIAVWELYNSAALDASIVSNTRNGEMYYVGVCMPSNF